MQKSKIGAVSLTVAILGMLTLVFGIKLAFLKHEAWYVLLAGFEAAVIGGFADWFAVKALFVEIPIPFVKKHTNIIVRSREKITDGITDLVSNQWMSKDSITERINAIKITPKLLEFLNTKEKQKAILKFFKPLALEVVNTVDKAELSQTINNIIKKQLETEKLSQPLSQVVHNYFNNKQQEKLYNTAINATIKYIGSDEGYRIFYKQVAQQTFNYRQKSGLKSLVVNTAQVFPGLSDKAITKRLQLALVKFLKAVNEDENHPVKAQLNTKILQFNSRLEANDESALQQLDNVIKNIEQHLNLDHVILKQIESLQAHLKENIENEDSDLMQMIENKLSETIKNLEHKPQFLNTVETFLKDGILQIIDTNHHIIATTVSNSLNQLSDKDLVSQIEDKVRDDLQYIRLNGAVVGGIIGMLLYLIKQSINIM